MLLVYILLVSQTVFAKNVLVKTYYDLEDIEFHFETFTKLHNKNYQDEIEKAERLQIFKENVNQINEMNKNDPHCAFDINKFSDLKTEEFIKKHTGLRAEYDTPNPCKQVLIANSSINLPSSFDWRDRILIPIKDQSACGSCWAFSATGNVEAQYAIKHKKPIVLSEQQLLDCDFSENGCLGGLYTRAFRYLIESGGQTTEKEYPYEFMQRNCRFSPEQAKVRVSDCLSLALTDEDLIKEALVKYGPLSAAIDGGAIYRYQRGVLTDCVLQELNHAVLIVGYGTDDFSGDFWVIKNSWGVTWGEGGFARIQRGINACGIYNQFLATSIVV